MGHGDTEGKRRTTNNPLTLSSKQRMNKNLLFICKLSTITTEESSFSDLWPLNGRMIVVREQWTETRVLVTEFKELTV